MLRRLRLRTAIAACLCLQGCASAYRTPAANFDETLARAELLDLDQRLMRSQLIDQDGALFIESSTENFRLMAPGGMFEDRQNVLHGLSAWDVADISLSGREVVFNGNTAMVLARLDIEGTMTPIGRWGPLKMISTYLHADEGWRLFSRALTECHPKLVESGRC